MQQEFFPVDYANSHEEKLYIDTAYLGKTNSKKLFIITSGTHGIEGFVGAACQFLFLISICEVTNKMQT